MRTRHVTKPLAVALLGALLVAAACQSAAPRGTYAEIYDFLEQAAALGDARNAAYVETVDAYLVERGLALADLELRPDGPLSVTNGLERFRLDGMAPLQLRVFNDTIIRNETEFEAYRALRHGSLMAIASRAPQRAVEVVVTPSRLIGIGEFLGALGCTCEILGGTADAFAGEEWLASVGTGQGHGRIWHTAAEFENDLRDAASGGLPGFPEQPNEMRLTTRMVRLRLPAADALGLSAREEVLLVDPIADVQDRFRWRALMVEVHNTPDVFSGWYAPTVLRVELRPRCSQAVAGGARTSD